MQIEFKGTAEAHVLCGGAVALRKDTTGKTNFFRSWASSLS